MNRFYLKEFFTFHKKDRNGILFLLFLIILAFTLHFSIDYFYANDEVYDFSEMDSIARKFNSNPDFNLSENETYIINQKKDDLKLFVFDPNYVTKNEMLKLGLNGFQSDNIIKYRKMGGRFKDVDDFGRIYGLDSILFERLKPFISIENDNHEKANGKNTREKIQDIENKIELNSAGIIELQHILGVEESISRRIIGYRDLLGGFYSFNQLYEVYHIDSADVERIMSKTTIDDRLISKQNLNVADYSDILRHPYMKKFQVDAIISLRKKGKITDIQSLTEYKILDSNTFAKVKYYIDIQ